MTHRQNVQAGLAGKAYNKSSQAGPQANILWKAEKKTAPAGMCHDPWLYRGSRFLLFLLFLFVCLSYFLFSEIVLNPDAAAILSHENVPFFFQTVF